MNLDRRSFLAAAAALGVVPTRLLAAQGAVEGLVGQVGAVFDRRGLRSEGVAGVTRAGPGGRAIVAGDRWHLGSNSKAMTAALYAVLVERGVFRWEATLPALFPGLAVHPEWSAVTIEQVMGHVAGLDDRLMAGAWLMQRHLDRRPVAVQRAEFARELLAQPPGPTRGRFAYCNAGFVLVGAAIERATGQSWEEVMTRRLFAPLGMRRSGFGAPTGDSPWGHRGKVAVDPAGLADNPPVLGPAGRVHLSMSDYGRFLGLFLQPKSRLLRADTIAHLLRPPVAGATYAGGWGLQRSAGGGRALVHEGSNTMWHAITALYPDEGAGYCVVANEAGGAARTRLVSALDALRRGSASPSRKVGG
ncbi:serine hydrolase domain-containing protein [Sphingomonas kaistensis]|uniref:Serine hydrolase domain-containing protein n=1 Tax=Sphingomonas kaistensis TaxID=298708 RepID=A0ABZ2G3Y2_9SPHN